MARGLIPWAVQNQWFDQNGRLTLQAQRFLSQLLPRPYVIALTSPNGVLSAGQILGYHRLAADVSWEANFGPSGQYVSEAGGSANATADTVLAIDLAPNDTPNTFVSIGSCTILAGTVSFAFATVSGTAKSGKRGDVLRITGPTPADATFANPYITIAGHL